MTSLQEIVTIVSVSLIAIAATGMAFGIIRVAWPNATPDVPSLLLRPHAYSRAHWA